MKITPLKVNEGRNKSQVKAMTKNALLRNISETSLSPKFKRFITKS